MPKRAHEPPEPPQRDPKKQCIVVNNDQYDVYKPLRDYTQYYIG